MLFRSTIFFLPLLALTAATPSPLGLSLGLGASISIGAGSTDDNNGGVSATWFQTNEIADPSTNSTVKLNEGGNGVIPAIGGEFYANSGVRWNETAIEVGFAAGTNGTNSVGGGWTIVPGGISVGAGITYAGQSVSFSLSIDNTGTVAASIFGPNLDCVGSETGATASCQRAS